MLFVENLETETNRLEEVGYLSQKSKGFDKDLEILKLQIMASARESDAQRSLSTAFVFTISLGVFVLGLIVAWRPALWLVAVLLAVIIVTSGYGSTRALLVYKTEIREMDGYLQRVREELPLPPLEETCTIQRIRFYHKIVARIAGVKL